MKVGLLDSPMRGTEYIIKFVRQYKINFYAFTYKLYAILIK